MNCGHYPAKHEKLGREQPKAEAKEDSLQEIASKFQAKQGHELSHTWEIDANELRFTKRLGEGTSAKVFRGIYRSQDVAIKVLKEQVDSKELNEFMKEFAIMRYHVLYSPQIELTHFSSLRSPQIVYFYGACIKPSLCMVLEYCSRGSLFDCLNRVEEDITWSRVLKIASDMLKGINCLHSWKPQIVHRDLKPENMI